MITIYSPEISAFYYIRDEKEITEVKKSSEGLLMTDHSCENCNFRSKYDNNPKSLLGRIWHWHAKWCPGKIEGIKSVESNDINGSP